MNFSFNAEETESFSNELPQATYDVTIAEAVHKPSKSNPRNFMLALVYIISEGEHDGWKIYDNFNVTNTNDIAQRIGLSDLKKLTEAVGLKGFETPSELVGHTLKVSTKNKEYNGRMSANVVDYKPASSAGAQGSEMEIPFA